MEQLCDNGNMNLQVVIPGYCPPGFDHTYNYNIIDGRATNRALNSKLCLFLWNKGIAALSYRTFLFNKMSERNFTICTSRPDVTIVCTSFIVHESMDFSSLYCRKFHYSNANDSHKIPCTQIIHFTLHKSHINNKWEYIKSRNYLFYVHKKIVWGERVSLIFVCICTFGFILFSFKFRKKLFYGKEIKIYNYNPNNDWNNLLFIPQKKVTISLIEKLGNGKFRILLSRNPVI